MLQSSAPEASQTDSRSRDRCSACVGFRYQPAGLLQLGLAGSAQGINNSALTSTERFARLIKLLCPINHISSTNRDFHWLPVKCRIILQTVSDDVCSHQPPMSGIHRRAAHRDVFCYFMIQTAIVFQQSLRSSSDSTKVGR